MSLLSRILTTALSLSILIGIGAVDWALNRNNFVLPVIKESKEQIMQLPPPLGQETQSGSGMLTESGSARKDQGPDVLAILAAQGLLVEENSEVSLLRRVLPADTAVTSRTLLKDSDRLCFLSFAQTPDAKTAFIALKQALLKSFSPDVKDLADQNDIREGKPNRNILTFLDPTISAERMIFIRSRESIFELHVPEGKFNQAMALVDALTE